MAPMELAHLQDQFLSDPMNPTSLEAYQNALLESEDLEALREMHRILFDAFTPEANLDAFLRQTDMKARTAATPELSGELYGSLGRLFWRKGNEPDKAELYFRRVKGKTDAFDGDLHEFYLEFYTRRGNWRRLEQFLMEAAGNPEDPGSLIPLKRDLAHRAMAAEKLDKAISFWSSVQDLCGGTDDEAEDELQELYGKVGKWHSLVDLLSKKVKNLESSEVAEKTEILLEIVAIYRTHIKSDPKVNSTYQLILDIDPTNPEAIDSLVSQYESMKRWPDLVRVLQNKITYTEGEEELILLHRKVASIMMERFSNSAEAMKSYKAILELEPEDAESIEALKDIYLKRRDFESYLLLARREVALLENDEERVEKFVELARFASEHIRKPAAAIELWEDVLTIHEDLPEGLEHLEGLYEREKDYGQLVNILERRLNLVTEPDEIVPMLDKLGLVLTARLKDEDKAAAVWRRLLEVQPEHRKAQNELRKRALASQDWETLEWLYRSYGTIAELVRTLDSQVKSLTNPQEKTSLLFTIANLWQNEMEQPLRAIKSLETILSLESRNVEAARALAPLYEMGQKWSSLAEVLEVALSDARETDERLSILRRLSKLYEEKLRSPDQAFFSYIQVFKESFESMEQADELQRLANLSDNWETFVDVLEESIPRLKDAQVRILAQLRTAEIFRDKLEDQDASLRHYQAVHDADSTNRIALDAMEVIYDERGQWKQLIEILKRKEGLGRNEDEKREVLFRIGGIWRDQLSNNEEAAKVFQSLMEGFPTDSRVHRELSAIYAIEEDHDGLLKVMGKELLLLQEDLTAQPGEVARLHCQIAELLYATTDRIDEVVLNYTSALEAKPLFGPAVSGLEELISSAEVQSVIAEVLEGVYESQENWTGLADIYELHLRYRKKKGEQVRLLEELGQLYRDKLEDGHRAFRSYGRIFAARPAHKEAREELLRYAEELGLWFPLVELYESRVESIGKDSLRHSIRGVIARTYLHQLEELEQAQLHFEALLVDSDNDEESIASLEGIYRATEQWNALLEILRRKISLTDDEDIRVGLLFQSEEIWSQNLGEIQEAILVVREVLEAAPEHPDAHERLDGLYTRAEQWGDLADTLTTRVRLADEDGERTELLSRLAQVRESALEDLIGAIDVHALILENSPGYPDSIAALERLFEAGQETTTIAPLLAPHYEESDEWQKLIPVYEVRKEAADSPLNEIEWDFKIAALHEEKGEDLEFAFLFYGFAYQAVPENTRALENILRLTETLGNQAEAIQLLEGNVDDVSSIEHQCTLHQTIAALALNALSDREIAKKHQHAILALDSGRMEAIDALLSLYRAGNEWAQVIETLQQKSGLAEDVVERSSLLKEAGMIAAGELENPESAIEIFESVRGLVPDDSSVLDALESLYARIEDWGSLVELLSTKIQSEESLDGRKALAYQKASIFENEINSLDQAVESYLEVLDWDPNDVESLRQLDALFTKKGDWLDLLQILERTKALVDSESAGDLQFRMGRIWERELESPAEAIQAYATLLDQNPSDERGITALEAIVVEKDERESAFGVLVPVLEVTEAYERLYELHEVLVDLREEPHDRVALLVRMGEIAEQHIGMPNQAFGCYARGLEDVPRDAACLSNLERLAQEHSLWEELQTLYVAIAENGDDPDRSLELELRVGEILKGEIGDPARAIAQYEKLMEDYSDHAEVLNALDELYLLTEKWDGLSGILRGKVETCTDPIERIALYFRLAATLEDSLEDASGAFECYQEVLFQDEENEDAISEIWRLTRDGVNRGDGVEVLEPIYTRQERFSDLRALLEISLEDLSDPADKSDQLRRIAELSHQSLGEPTVAMGWFGKALVLDPEDEMSLSQLESLAEANDAWQPLTDALLEAAETADDDRKVELWLKASKATLEKLDNREDTELLFLQILAVDEERESALVGLDTLYTQDERWDELEAVLTRRVAVAEYEDEQVRVLTRLSALYRDRLDRKDDAIEALKSVVELDESNLSALQDLANLYRESGRSEALFNILENLSLLVAGEEERSSTFEEMALLAENELDRSADAIGLWEEVLLLKPAHMDALHQLQRLLEEAAKWEELAESIERELRILGDSEPERLAIQHRKLGVLWRDVLEEPLQSQRHWERVLEFQSGDREALDSLRDVYRDGGAVEPLAGILEQLVQLDSEAASLQLDWWIELAGLRQTALGQPHGAIDAWSRVVDLDPAHEEALDQLELLHSQEGEWSEATQIMRKKMVQQDQQGNPAEALELLVQIAETLLIQVEDKEAASHTFAEVLERDPGNLDASYQLEQLCEEREDWEQLASLLLGRIDHLEDKADRIPTLHKLIQVYETRMEDPTSAFLVSQRAVDEDGEDPHSLMELERLATLTKEWEALVDTWKRSIPTIEDTMLQTDYWMKLGIVLRDQLERLEESVPYFAKVLDEQPEHLEALVALAELHSVLEEWPELIEILTAQIDATVEFQEQIGIAVRVGDIYERQLSDTDSAIAAYRRVLDLDERADAALDALERLYRDGSQWPSLIEIFILQIDAHPDREIERRLLIGQVQCVEMGEDDDAIKTFEDVLDLDPANKESLAELERLYQERSDWEGLVGVYERLLNASDDVETRKALCNNIAMVQEEVFGDSLKAAEYFHQILDIDPMATEALDKLASIYEATESWDDLIQALDRHVEVSPNTDHQINLLVKIASVYKEKNEDLDNAIRTFERILVLSPGDSDALDALEGLYRENEFFEQVITILEEKINRSAGSEKTELRCQKARVLSENMLNPEEAVRELNAALDEDDTSLQAIGALQAVYATVDDWENVVHSLEREVQMYDNVELQAETLSRIAEVYRDNLMDQDKAVEAYERALVAIPHYIEAAVCLSELYVRQERWESAAPLLSMLEERIEGEEDPEKQAELLYIIGRSKENLLEIDEAIEAYQKSLKRRPNHPQTLRSLAQLTLRKQRYPEAERFFTSLLEMIQGEATDEELIVCHMSLGEIALATSQDEAALKHLEEVIALQPNNPDAIMSLVQLAREHENWGAVIRYQEEIIPLKHNPIEQLALQIEVGDVYREKLQDHDGAIQAYQEALNIEPGSKAALGKLLQLFLVLRRFSDAIQILQQLVDQAEDNTSKANHAFMLALIYKDELNDIEQAVFYLNETLDADYTRLEAFRTLDELLTSQHAWKEEERAYRKMIERVEKDENPDLEFMLYKGLGEIYRSRLKDTEYAIPAFQLAAQRRPQDVKVHEILAELFEESEETYPKAIEAHRRLIHLEPNKRAENYVSIYSLYRKTKDDDAAWLIAGLLHGLGQATDEMTQFYLQHRKPSMVHAPSQITGDLWQTHLLMNQGDLTIGRIFQILYQTVGGALRRQNLKDFGLKKKESLLDLGDGSLFSNVINRTGQIMNVTIPPVYISERQLGIQIVNLEEPSILVGTDMLSGRSEKELAFLIGKVLTFFLPVHIMAGIYSRADLKSLFLASLHVVSPDAGLADGNEELQNIGEAITENISPEDLATLGELLEKTQEPGNQINLSTWVNNVDLTGNRVGMLLCSDFSVALNTLQSRVFAVGKVAGRETARELVLYNISAPYMQLRRKLGITLDGSSPASE